MGGGGGGGGGGLTPTWARNHHDEWKFLWNQNSVIRIPDIRNRVLLYPILISDTESFS